jgi:DNA-binding NarL/FixJ family response regulator
LVCAADAMVRTTCAAAVSQAGFELVGETDSGADTIALATYVHPDLIVIDNDLPWNPGVEWVTQLHDEHPLTAILLIANDQSIRERAVTHGAFGVVYRSNLGELEGAIKRAAEWLANPELRKPGERRTGKDRRWHQDWMKVTHERRTGVDRRHQPG